MRFTCEKNMLVTGLNIAGRTVAQKSSLSVIEGILCKAGQGLSLTGYNMETAITYEIDADVSDMGQCILPAKLFGDIIRRLPEGSVTVVVDENYKVSIRAGYASFTISAESAEDYPELPDVGDGRAIHIPQNKLKELISSTIFAVSENQGRPIHTGVKFEVTDSSITAVAVDGFRLARRTFHPEEGTGREMNFVVPAAGLKEVEKILTDVEDDAAFTLGTKHILFQVGNATLVCRLLEGEFLDWRRVVPSNCPIKMVANVGDLASSVERVGLIVSEKYKSPVRCVFGNQELQMRTNTTIGAVFTNAKFDKAHLCKIAAMTHDGYARAIRPVHTANDGDSIYAVSLGDLAADQDVVGALAARVMAEAILRAVQAADSAYGFPAAKDLKR